MSEIMSYEFTVDLNLVGMDAIRASGCQFYGDESVVAAMSRATVARGKIRFFKAGRFVPAHKKEAECAKYGLKPVDPHTLAAFNMANPEFADSHPNCTQWVDEEGKLCCAFFYGRHDVRYVRVHRNIGAWDDRWWLAGVSK